MLGHGTSLGDNRSYLGDGLYATFDGWQIVLRAPRSDGDHWVALEPETFTTLVRFAERINGKYGVIHFDALHSPVSGEKRPGERMIEAARDLVQNIREHGSHDNDN